MATHFQGKKIDYIDVVNEPINTPPTGFMTVGSATTPAGSVAPDGGGYLNALGGTGTTGYGWVITSFQLARQYFPASKLVINEYSVENSSARAATCATIINLLKARNLINDDGTKRPALVWLRGYVQSTALATKAVSAASAAIFPYPNPAQGSVSLSLPISLSQQTVEVSLLNTLGQNVVHQVLPPSVRAGRSLPPPGVARDLYTVRLQTSTGVFSQRLTVD